MHGTRFVFAAALAVVALAAACGGDEDGTEGAGTTDTTTTETTATDTTEPSTTTGTTLRGSVGPGFVITLTTQDGQPVEELPAGRYEIEVEDRSPIHNFHLTGPGVDVSTSVAGEGTESFELELVSGTHTFLCDPHATQMNGTFDVV